MDNEERFKPEWRDFEKRFQDQMGGYVGQIKDLPADERAKIENLLRDRFRREEKETADLEANEPDFYNPSTQGKHMSLNEFLHFDAGQIVKTALLDRPNDFEWRFRSSLKDHREKLDTLPPAQRTEFEKQWREKFATHEKGRMEYLNDHDKFSFEGLTSLIENEEADLKQSVDKAHGQARAEKLRDDLKAKTEQAKPREMDRER